MLKGWLILAAKLKRKVFLTGFMGAGKTTAGSVLAEITGADFVDLDSVICESVPGRIDEIISRLGEKGFRKIEADALARVCSRSGAAVVSTGGGVVISVANRRSMEQAGVVIYLKAKVETLMRRISRDAPRPLLKVEDPEQKAAELFAGRKSFYETARFTVETDGLTAREAAEKAADLLLREGLIKK